MSDKFSSSKEVPSEVNYETLLKILNGDSHSTSVSACGEESVQQKDLSSFGTFTKELDLTYKFWENANHASLSATIWERPEPTQSLAEFALASVHPDDRGLIAYALDFSAKDRKDSSAAEALESGELTGNLSHDKFLPYLTGTANEPSDKFKKAHKGFSTTTPLTPSRAVPQSVTVLPAVKSVKDVDILWLLKNPGYGADDAVRIHMLHSPEESDNGLSPQNALMLTILEIEEENQYKLNRGEAASLPWEQLKENDVKTRLKNRGYDQAAIDRLDIPAALKNRWYVNRARNFVDRNNKTGKGKFSTFWNGSQDTWEDIFDNASSLGGSDTAAHRIARFELFPYRTKSSREIPKFITLLNKHGIVLPSQERAIRTLCAFLRDADEAQHPFIICGRDAQAWTDLIYAYCEMRNFEADKIVEIFNQHVWEFKSQNAYLKPNNLVPPYYLRKELLRQEFKKSS